MPKYLADHKKSSPNSINFQVIAGRGKGKSTMVREILSRMGEYDSKYKGLPESGSSETTKIPTPYKFKTIKTVYFFFWNRNNDVYLWDMPGLGGKKALDRNL